MRLAVFPIVLAALLSTPALAAPRDAEELVTLRVPYADLDLVKEADRAALEARVAARLRQVCRQTTISRYTLGRAAVDQKCVADGIAAAKFEVERLATTAQPRGREMAAN